MTKVKAGTFKWNKSVMVSYVTQVHHGDQSYVISLVQIEDQWLATGMELTNKQEHDLQSDRPHVNLGNQHTLGKFKTLRAAKTQAIKEAVAWMQGKINGSN